MRTTRVAVSAGAALACVLAAGAAGAKELRPGLAEGIADWVKRNGDNVRETTIFGLKPTLRFSETLEYTDNVYYAAKDEKIVVSRNPDGIPAFGDTTLANPKFGKPPGRVHDFRNTVELAAGLDWKLNPNLGGLLVDAPEKITVLAASITSTEYARRGGPDAVNTSLRSEIPFLLNNLFKVRKEGSRFYFDAKGDYSRITDPLGVQKFELNNNQLKLLSNVESFERVEWSASGTFGWKGKSFDAKVTGRYYSMSFTSSQFRQAEHVESSWYGEVGFTIPKTSQRVFGLYEYTDYAFDGNKDFPDAGISDFARTRTGLGWEGPVLSKKMKGRAQLVYMATENFHNGLDAPGLFDEYHGLGASTQFFYKPWDRRDVQFQLQYERYVDFSAIANSKTIDRATFTIVNRFNKRLTGEFLYTLENTQVAGPGSKIKPGTIGVIEAPGNIRLFQEVGLGVKYELFKYGMLECRYSLRHQGSRNERASIFTDDPTTNQPYIVQPDNDFNVNILSIGLTVAF